MIGPFGVIGVLDNWWGESPSAKEVKRSQRRDKNAGTKTTPAASPAAAPTKVQPGTYEPGTIEKAAPAPGEPRRHLRPWVKWAGLAALGAVVVVAYKRGGR